MKKILLIFLLVFVSDCFPQYIPQFLNKPSVGYQINLARPDAQGLVGFWIFNEGVGNKVFDLSAHGNDGTLTNMIEDDWVAGRDGWALDFDGINKRIHLPDIEFGGTNPITISAWVLANVVDGSDNMVSQGTQIVLRINGANIQFILNSFSTNDRVTTAHNMSIGVWYHIVGTYNTGGDIVVYIDAVEKGRVTPTGTYANDTAGFRIGSLGVNDHWDGLISDVRIYQRAFSAQEVLSLYTYPYAVFEQPPGRILAAAAAAIRRRGAIIVF